MVLMAGMSFLMMFMVNKMPKPDKEQMEEMQRMTGGQNGMPSCANQ